MVKLELDLLPARDRSRRPRARSWARFKLGFNLGKAWKLPSDTHVQSLKNELKGKIEMLKEGSGSFTTT